MEVRLFWPEGVPQTEFNRGFIQGMLQRMAMSYSTYGRVADAFPDKVDALKSLQKRLDKYKETKNTEWLIDAANFCMIEFMRPSLDGAHFETTTARESPGRKWHGEGYNKDQNT